MFSKFSNNNNVISQKKLAVTLTSKVLVDQKFYPVLEELLEKSTICVNEMLIDRTKSSSKYYKTIPCVLSKSLIVKYQKNKLCKEVKRMVLPVCSDKGKVIKTDGNKIKIPAFFKKEQIGVVFGRCPNEKGVKSVEFFKRNKQWIMSYTYEPIIEHAEIIETNAIGVDFNVRGNVCVLADTNGKVRHLGPDVGKWKYDQRRRRRKLQIHKKVGLCKKLSGKQARRQKEINHKVSKQLINYAINHKSCIVLEDLNPLKPGSKIAKYSKKSQWAFYQLKTFIQYKANLHSIPVHFVNPAYTSKMCSICKVIQKQVTGKKFLCSDCGHSDHRDANAAHNIRSLYLDRSEQQSLLSEGPIDSPYKLGGGK